ncbi:MAG: efflux transporter outer membrane subunit [Candidatus Omnitrophica bacterium]|nr:efflux transporter outer membrane subunit [Candidatus Omnitrophota bacterium]
MKNLINGLVIGSLMLTSGCCIGPKYKKPQVSVPLAYKESTDWKKATPQDEMIKGEWWKIFNDKKLDALEDELNISNQNIASAQAQYAQAYALVQAARSAFFPTLSTAASYTRSHSGSSSSHGYAVSQDLLSANVSWELDLWGRVRRELEANKASAEGFKAELENVRLSMQAQLAQNYFQLCSLDAQKKLLDDTVVVYKKFMDLTKKRYDSGIAALSDVLQARTQLEAARAGDIDVGVARAQVEHAIAVLIGKPAADVSLNALKMPSELPAVPIGLPSALLERRWDIAQAERKVAQANALIGVAQAAYYPTLTLSASGSYQSSSLSRLFSSPNPLWSVGPALAQSIFDAGLRQAQMTQAKAVYDQDVAQYRQTVLTAFQQVEDNLAALRILEQEAQAQDEVVKDAQKSLDIITNQYKQGTVSALEVITLEATAYNAQKEAVTILGQRLNASVLLIEYLGGGWSSH